MIMSPISTLLPRGDSLLQSVSSDACPCGLPHPRVDHCQFIESMPADPAEAIGDLHRMGFYQPEATVMAERVTHRELRKTLLLRAISRGNPRRERLARALIAQAGGLDAAIAAAFGPKAGEYFGDAIRTEALSRREFVRNLAIGAALVSLANCSRPAAEGPDPVAGEGAAEVANLEKTTIKVGFVPITCATPILMAKTLGIYEKYGLNVELVKVPGWAAVRDAIIAGELDASHLIAPMPITMSLGVDSLAFPTRTLAISNLNGNALTVAKQHEQTVKGPADFKGFRIAIPFPHSTHTLLLRYYLATGGVNPDTDVQLDVVPPPDTVALMAVGDLDAMFIAEPFNQRLVAEGAGYLHALSKDIWPGHPCCILGAGQAWMDAHPNTFRAMTKAVVEAAHYAKGQKNRLQIAETLAPRNFLNQPREVLEAIYTGKYEDGRGNTFDVPDRVDFDPYPWHSFSTWIVTQLARWNEIDRSLVANSAELGQEIFLTDLIKDLSDELGLPVPTKTVRDETLLFDTLEAGAPTDYLQQQLETYGI